MPSSRDLAGLQGNLYDRASEAHHKSLEALLGVLMRTGFKGMKKKASETTLRIYPVKLGAYPLLNPGFEGVVKLASGKSLKESLVFWVNSRGDSVLHEFLRSLPAEGTCPFFAERRLDLDGSYVLHGRFGLPLSFRQQGDGLAIDFEALMPAAAHLRRLLHHRSAG
jgi:hypothetical protein